MLSKNGRKTDKQLISEVDNMNCKETVTMLRSYDQSNEVEPGILTSSLKRIFAVKEEINALDLTEIMRVFFKYLYIPERLEALLDYGF